MSKKIQTQPVFGRTRQIHMVGIGGIGMSGIAEILLLRGYTVTGSDSSLSETTQRLKELGAVILKATVHPILKAPTWWCIPAR
jgi:UDP-N-acetylmuramate--alanine ligase